MSGGLPTPRVQQAVVRDVVSETDLFAKADNTILIQFAV
jgi:hypothetical protein